LGDGQTLGESQTSGDSLTLEDSQTLGDSHTSLKVGATTKSGGNPETQKVGGIQKNSGETLKNRRDCEIGGSAKNRSGGIRGRPQKTEELG